MATDFQTGDLVWARMKGYPPWPAKVTKPNANHKKPKGPKAMKFIFFFGTNNFAWIENSQIKPYDEFTEVLGKVGKTVPFKESIMAIEEYKTKLANGEIPPEVEDETPEEPPATSGNGDEAKEEVELTGAAKINRRRARKITKGEAGVSENGESEVEKEVVQASTKRKRKFNNGSAKGAKSSKLATDSKPSSSVTQSNPTPLLPGLTNIQRKSAVANFLDRPGTISKIADVPLNISHVSQTLKDKKITPSSLKFGFLGLGTMGSGIVKNLLNSEHRVTVWNRSTDKCKDFLAAGADQGMTPGDVIQICDITFACVADPLAAREMVFGNCGVLQEITAAKSYVEMTGTDAETSIDIAEAIGSKGGRYLEAQIQGSKGEAEEGTLVILAAGDRGLYEECQSAFQAIGKHSFFLGDVGNATKMNVVMQLIQGVSVATLSEGLALADRAGLQQRDVMEILALTNMSCPLFLEKGNGIIEGSFPTYMPLQHMQKDLNLALGMGHILEQPLPLAATSNEIYKHAKRLGYGEHDVAAVYIRARF